MRWVSRRYDTRNVSAFREIDLVRVEHGEAAPAVDRLAVEAPLEVRLEGESFAVIMRTPGADEDLPVGAAGRDGERGRQREHARADQDENDKGRQFCGGFGGLSNQVPGQPPLKGA